MEPCLVTLTDLQTRRARLLSIACVILVAVCNVVIVLVYSRQKDLNFYRPSVTLYDIVSKPTHIFTLDSKKSCHKLLTCFFVLPSPIGLNRAVSKKSIHVGAYLWHSVRSRYSVRLEHTKASFAVE